MISGSKKKLARLEAGAQVELVVQEKCRSTEDNTFKLDPPNSELAKCEPNTVPTCQLNHKNC